ncbi:MAG: KEOPS complex subunit Cgi121 [Candidatus Bathyarchaeota archaeon]|nr:KEOPS complex subunit Cgi121 [Candidatus Bathyarchaeota archaeon]
MLKCFAEFGEYVEITGFRNVKIGDAGQFLEATRREQRGTAVQFFNAELVATWQHLYFAVLNALTAFSNKTNISKNIAMETMLYASAQRQIQKAIALVGVKCDSANVAVVVIGKNQDAVKKVLSEISKRMGAEPDETVLALYADKVRRICRAYGISEKELETVTKKGEVEQALINLVIEHMALLSTQL